MDKTPKLRQNAPLHETTLHHFHWNEIVISLIKFSSLAALKVVKMTTFRTASDGNFIRMTTFPFNVVEGNGRYPRSIPPKVEPTSFAVRDVCVCVCVYEL